MHNFKLQKNYKFKHLIDSIIIYFLSSENFASMEVIKKNV